MVSSHRLLCSLVVFATICQTRYFGTEHQAIDSGGGRDGGRPQSRQEDSVHPVEVAGGNTKSKEKHQRKMSVAAWQTGESLRVSARLPSLPCLSRMKHAWYKNTFEWIAKLSCVHTVYGVVL